jgi:hypothetical protein
MMIQERAIYLSLYSKTRFSTIASGATPIRSAGRAPDKILTCIKKAEKANKDVDSLITTIGREFILFKVRQPEDFRAEIVKQGCDI